MVSTLVASTILISTDNPQTRFYAYMSWVGVLFVASVAALLWLPTVISQLVYGFSFTFIVLWCIMKHDVMINTNIEEIEVE